MPDCSRRRDRVPITTSNVIAQAPTTARVERSTNLREDASAYEDPLELVPAGIVSPSFATTPVERYYKVRLPSGREGWVYGPNITIESPSGVVGPAGGIVPVPRAARVR